jgi:hypothetical protein
VVEEIERHRSFGTTTARQFLIGRTSKGKERKTERLVFVCVWKGGEKLFVQIRLSFRSDY